MSQPGAGGGEGVEARVQVSSLRTLESHSALRQGSLRLDESAHESHLIAEVAPVVCASHVAAKTWA